MWTRIQIILGVLALLLAFGGDKLSMPILFYAGVGCFGLTAMAVGWEAILTQHIVLGKRRYGNRKTYTGIPAIFQGAQFNFLGLFLIGIAFMMYFNNGQEIVRQIARRPGSLLVLLGGLCLMQSVIAFTGSPELKAGPRWVVIMNLFVSRLLPGLILLVVGVAATGLGLFEAVAPTTFDNLGGGFLEVVYGLE